MTQVMNMHPEEVQHGATSVLTNVKNLKGIVQRLNEEIDSLNDEWQAREAMTIVAAAKADLKTIDQRLDSLDKCANIAIGIANRRIERENKFTNILNR